MIVYVDREHRHVSNCSAQRLTVIQFFSKSRCTLRIRARTNGKGRRFRSGRASVSVLGPRSVWNVTLTLHDFSSCVGLWLSGDLSGKSCI